MEDILSNYSTEIHKEYKNVTRTIMERIAKNLYESGYPLGKHFVFKGGSEHTVSKVKNKECWIEMRDNKPVLCSNLCAGTKEYEEKGGILLYHSDWVNSKTAIAFSISAKDALENWSKYAEVLNHINNGGKCYYQFGYSYRGAGPREISSDKARELFPKYSFGMGFYELDWREINGQRAIVFNEYSENDLY